MRNEDRTKEELISELAEVRGRITELERIENEHKRAERLQEAVYRIARAAATSRGLDYLFRAVHEIIQEVMPARNFYIALYDEKQDLLTFPYFVDEVDIPSPPQKPGKGLTEYVLRKGISLLCTEAIHQELQRRGEAELVGIPSPIWLGVPLIVQNKTIGVMVVQHYSDEKAYGKDEQSILEFVSSQVAEAIERKRAEEKLRRSEEKYRALFEESKDVVFISTPEGKLLDINPAGVELFGYASKEEFLKVDIAKDLFFSRQERARFQQALVQQGFVKDYEITLKRKDGEKVVVLETTTAVRDDKGTIVRYRGIMRDVMQRKQAEEDLRESEERYRTLFEGSRDAIYITTREGKVVDMNQASLDLFGYTKEETMELNARDLYLEHAYRIEFQREIERNGYVRDYEVKLRKKDGTEIDCLETSTVRRARDGSILGYEGVIRDITDRKLVEKKVSMLAHAIRSISECVSVTDMQDNILFVNEAFLKTYGYSEHELTGKPISVVRSDNNSPHLVEQILPATLRGGWKGELLNRRSDGSDFPIFLSTSVVHDEKGQAIALIAASTDITERKRAEEELEGSRQRLRDLSARLQAVREEEKSLIAREIHDELGQALTGLKMDLSWLTGKLPDYKSPRGRSLPRREDHKALVRKTRSMSKLIDKTIQTVRRISTRLRPAVLDDLGLVAAIEWQAQEFQARTGIQFKISSNLEEEGLDRERTTALFRIFQETLTNIARHAKATRVNVSLNQKDGEVTLVVRDNGKGIGDSEISDPKSLGLLGMRERAIFLDGKVTISGGPGKGTTVTVRIPLTRQ